jgi:hypothetical protein
MVDEEMPVDTVPADDSTTPALTGAQCVRAGRKFDDMTRT